MSASLASHNIFQFLGFLYSPDSLNSPNSRHYSEFQKCRDLCSIICNLFVVVTLNQIRHLSSGSINCNQFVVVFQINLDICVPLVVSQNIRLILQVWRVRTKQVGECWRVWRVRANQVGECRRVWRVQPNQVGKCRRVWRVRHISKKGHFGEYSNSPKMANFR